jgi:hypothetical protein
LEETDVSSFYYNYRDITSILCRAFIGSLSLRALPDCTDCTEAMLFFLPVNTSTKTGADTPRLNRKANRVYVYDSPSSDFKDLIGQFQESLERQPKRFALIGLSYRAGTKQYPGALIEGTVWRQSSKPVSSGIQLSSNNASNRSVAASVNTSAGLLLPTHESLRASVRDGSVRGCRGRPQQKECGRGCPSCCRRTRDRARVVWAGTLLKSLIRAQGLWAISH